MALTAIDTNVIVRLLTRDDPQQLLAAKRCFAAGEGGPSRFPAASRLGRLS